MAVDVERGCRGWWLSPPTLNSCAGSSSGGPRGLPLLLGCLLRLRPSEAEAPFPAVRGWYCPTLGFTVGGAVSKIAATSFAALGGVASLLRCPPNCPSRAPVTVRYLLLLMEVVPDEVTSLFFLPVSDCSCLCYSIDLHGGP